ncbi:type II toxin-antitoxin system RelE/ParE family toxin [Nesterenkonia alkaliphila]|uniref:Killer protein n=1 Tax=Nesterenkonia alkaliphila TaxID=1463631 RepID=A0A7K1UIQ3_9MICC|nr:type II toxin-antitoxin system RelE/ParE family toxin [Nesterenkonia alkaliphila]MVT26252.1 Killer protein [Nesterenkonia alkaliphila]GFZ81265.1 hypothetical protein GCM10011359_07170 [Nesterenkonia alkaliphila]
MIISFRHKGLRLLYEKDSKRGVHPEHVKKLRRILSVLDQASSPEPLLQIPSLKAHPLSADQQGRWAVSVSGNWRVTFEFVGDDVELIDYEDYH